MIFRRRLLMRNQVLLFVFIMFLGLWFFIKSRNFVLVTTDDQKLGLLDHGSENVENNKDTEKELERLSQIDSQKLNDFEKENMLLMKKYNDSLILQKEDADPFHEKHLIESRYTDFTNFKIDFNATSYLPEHLRSAIDKLNSKHSVYNIEKLSMLPKEHAVIIVQVHKRIEYFKELLDSLQRSKGIEKSLLIISHDFYTDEMNALVRIIKFCPVIQIFFPYSLQLYPKTFPGPSETDCPRDVKKDKARQMGCVNAETPDMYGHYREAHIVMIKHHWWWKINTVMDGLEETKDHNGPFLFIEEDHYVAPSFLHALMKLHDFKKRDGSCKDSCDILTLGTYVNKHNFRDEAQKVMHGSWISTQHNMGMAIYRDLWEKLKNCANDFCSWDDYNWDWTLMHLSKSCLPKPMSVLLYDVPRVFHVGDCGLHHKKSCTTSKDTLNKIKGVIERNKDYLYSDIIQTYEKKSTSADVKANGGWGDSRDHELCLRFVYREDPL